MKKWFRLWPVLALLSLLLATTPASAYYFWIGVVDELGNPITSGVRCRVLTADSVSTNATIYSDAAYGTAATNPITASSAGKCDWYSSTSSFDVIVYHARGVSRIAALSTNDHLVRLDRQSPYKHMIFPFTYTGGLTETSTGLDLPEGAMVVDVVVEVTTKGATLAAGTYGTKFDASPYINIGLLTSQDGGSATGFVASLPASGTGFFRPGVTRRSDSAIIQQWIASSQRGGLLATWGIGYYAAGNFASPGHYSEVPWIVQSGKATTVTYSTGGHSGFAGYVHIWYLEVANR